MFLQDDSRIACHMNATSKAVYRNPKKVKGVVRMRLKRVVAWLLCVLMIVLAMPMFASATSANCAATETDVSEFQTASGQPDDFMSAVNDVIEANKKYQAVIDRVNARYGTKVRLATPEELKKVGLIPEKITISPEEFEAELIREIEASKAANLEAQEAASKLKRIKSDESGSGVCSPGRITTPMASYPYYHSKQVKGANVHLEARVFDTGGYWKFSSVESVWTTSTQSIPYPWFFAETYNYEFIDSRRTCAINIWFYYR